MPNCIQICRSPLILTCFVEVGGLVCWLLALGCLHATLYLILCLQGSLGYHKAQNSAQRSKAARPSTTSNNIKQVKAPVMQLADVVMRGGSPSAAYSPEQRRSAPRSYEQELAAYRSCFEEVQQCATAMDALQPGPEGRLPSRLSMGSCCAARSGWGCISWLPDRDKHVIAPCANRTFCGMCFAYLDSHPIP